MKPKIKVFGDNARAIKAGDLFRPVFNSVEGHSIVLLEKDETIAVILDQYDHSEIGLDDMLSQMRALTSSGAIPNV
jgi:hypothetical protein